MKKANNKFYQRVLALVLAVMLCVGMMPLAAFAEGEGEEPQEPAVVDIVEGQETVNDQPEGSDAGGNAGVSDDTDVGDGTDVSDDAGGSGNADVNDDANGSGNTDVNDDADESDSTDVSDDADGNGNTDASDGIDASGNTEQGTESGETPAEVQAFLDAVAKLPGASEVTAANAEAVGEQVNTVLGMWEAMSVENGEREDITEALNTAYALLEAVLAAEGVDGGETYNNTYECSSGVSKSAFQYADNMDQATYCNGIVKLNGTSEYDSGIPNIWATGGWGGATPATGYNWVQITSSNPNVATASYTTEGGKLKVTFTPGKASGTTKISVGVDARYYNDSLQATYNMNLNFDYAVTNNGGTVEPSEKPEKPTDADVKDFYNSNIAIIVRCVDQEQNKYNKYLHNGNLPSLIEGSYTIGEVETYDGSNRDLSTSEWGWMCRVHVKQAYYLDLWNSNFQTQYGTHYLADKDADVYAPFYYFNGGYCSYAGMRLSEGWYCLTEDAPVYVDITHKKPVEPTYTVTYTDGVPGQTVFPDQGTEGLKAGEVTPSFVGGDPTTYTDDDGNTYTFQGWKLNGTLLTPAGTVHDKVLAADADDDGNIIYTATWQKQLKDLAVSKSPSEEYPVVGEEFYYTIKVTNPNSKAIIVKITDKLNEKLDFVAAGDGGTYDNATRTVTWTDVTVPANGNKEVKVYVKANAAGEIYNEAKIECEVNETSGNTTVTAKEPDPIKRLFKVIYYNESGASWMSVEDSEKAGFFNMPEWQKDENVTENPHNMTVSDKVPTRDGYTFKHWQWGGDADATFAPGDTITLTANPETLTEVAADLFAVWEKNPEDSNYTVEWYDAGTGNLLPSTVKEPNPETRNSKVGAIVSVTDKDKSIDGYTFVVDDSRNVTEAEVKADGTTVLKLYFTKNEEPPEYVTLTYYSNDDRKLIDTTADIAKGTEVAIKALTDLTGWAREGYTFLGWSTSESADDLMFTAEALTAGVQTLKMDANKNLYAIWRQDPVEPADTTYTVVHEYYTNSSLTGSTRTAISGKVGDVVNAAGITKVTSYDGNSYTYSSAAPASITLNETGTQVITLRYDRTVTTVVDPTPTPTPTPTPQEPTPTPTPTATPTTEPTASPSAEPTDDPTDIPDPTPPLTDTPDITPTPSTPPVSPSPDPSEPPINIPDDDTPLAPSPDVTPDDTTEIDDEEVPLADVPKTGDDAKIWLTLALLSAAGLGVLGFTQRRTRKSGKHS